MGRLSDTVDKPEDVLFCQSRLPSRSGQAMTIEWEIRRVPFRPR